MRKFVLIAATAAALAAGVAQAAPAPFFNAVYSPGAAPLRQDVQYFWGGRNYCWYNNAWRGPGYYWCGYGGRRGYGWGGGYGWNGWRHDHYRPAGYGARREYFGGGDRGGRHDGGDHRGGGDHHVGGGDHHH